MLTQDDKALMDAMVSDMGAQKASEKEGRLNAEEKTYTLEVYVGQFSLKKITLTITGCFFAKINMYNSLNALKKKITEFVDSYSWTHFEIQGVKVRH